MNEGVVNYQEFFKVANDLGWSIKLYQFDPEIPYREIFAKIKKSRETNIIIDVKHKILLDVLKHVSVLKPNIAVY